MLTSINPLGERARGNRWGVTVAWVTVGSIAGGAAVGAVSGLIGSILYYLDGREGWRLWLIGAVAAGATYWELSSRRFPGHRQVNEDWLTSLRSWAYGIGFGAQLGAAVVTVVNTALVPMFLLAALLSSDAATGLLIGSAFGAVRALSVTLNGRVRSAGDLRALHRRLDRLEGRARNLSAGCAALLGAAATLGLMA